MIRLFELGSNNPQPLATFNGHKNNIVGLGFLSHNRLLYSGSEDGTIKLWDMRFVCCTLFTIFVISFSFIFLRSASMCKDFEKAEEACSFATILPNEVPYHISCSHYTIVNFCKKFIIATYQHGMVKILEHGSGNCKDIFLEGEKVRIFSFLFSSYSFPSFCPF